MFLNDNNLEKYTANFSSNFIHLNRSYLNLLTAGKCPEELEQTPASFLRDNKKNKMK